MSISKKAWTFPGRPYYYVLYFQKLIESSTTVRQKEERDTPGPPGQPRGESGLAGSFLDPAAPEGTHWAPGAAPCEEELPCRFLSRPVTLSWFGRTLAAPNNIVLEVLVRVIQFSSVQFSHSIMSDSATAWNTAHQASLSMTNSWSYSNSCPLSW